MEKLNENEMIEVGKLLKKIRLLKKETTSKVAEHTGYSQGHVSGIENGKRNIKSINYVIDVLKFLSDNYIEFNKYANDINKISNGKIKIETKNDNQKENTLYGAFMVENSPNIFKYTSYNGITSTSVEEFPINDLKFHFDDVLNDKYYRKIKLNDNDKKYINKMINDYLIRKIEIQKRESEYHLEQELYEEEKIKEHINELNVLINKLNDPTELSY